MEEQNEKVFQLLLIISLTIILTGCNNDENTTKIDNYDNQVVDIDEKDPRENVLNNEKENFITVYNIDGFKSGDKKNKDLPFIYSISCSKTLDGTFVNYDSEDVYKSFNLTFPSPNLKEENAYVYAVPYFNMNIEGIDKVNYTMKALCQYITSGISEMEATTCKTYISFKDSIMCVKNNISGTLHNGSIVFNIDLKNKKVLDFNSFLNELKINKEEFNKELQMFLNEIVKGNDNNDTKDSKEFFDLLVKSIDKNNYIYLGEINLNNPLIIYNGGHFDKNDVGVGGYDSSYYINDDNELCLEFTYKAAVQNGWDRKIFKYKIN